MSCSASRRVGIAIAGCVFCLALPAFAQLGIALKAKYSRYLRYEPIEVRVMIRNYSGNTLIFGGKGTANQGHLFFLVTRQDNQPVEQLDPKANPVENLVLGPGETRELDLELNNLFDLQSEGAYTVIAQIGQQRLPNDYQSNPITFEVREGIPVITRHIGLPTSNSTSMVRALKVTLLLFNNGERSLYCLRVEDKKNVYDTIRLGPQISGAPPQMDADASSAIHVLLQVASRLYSYSIFTITGNTVQLREQRYYVADQGVPTLSRAPGFLKVINARPAVQGKDYDLQSTAPGQGYR